jgi:hypothetical protein
MGSEGGDGVKWQPCVCGEVVIHAVNPDDRLVVGDTTHRLTGPCLTGMAGGVKLSLSDDLTWTTGEWERVEKYYVELNPGKEFTALYAKEQHDWRAAYRLKGLAAAGPSAVRPPRLSAEEISMGQYTVKDDDLINHPSHYTSSPAKCSKCEQPIECIDITRHMMFDPGNVVKYVWRRVFGGKAGEGDVEGLEKAVWYLQDEIKRLRGEA